MAWMKTAKHPARPIQTPKAPTPGPAMQRERKVMREVNIGKSMKIKGKITGNQDLMIDGRVDGKIFLKGHKLSIGATGRVTAAIRDAKTVVVGGEMIGNISANDKVEITSTGTMRGDIKAPRVVLADGAQYRGVIDMEPKGTASKVSTALPATTAKAATTATTAKAGRDQSGGGISSW